MIGRTPARAGKMAGAIGVAIAALAMTAGAASAEINVVYNNLPATVPPNVVSQSFEASQMSQFGGLVELAGTARKQGSVSVGMSSWACEKGSWTGTPECITTPGLKAEVPVTLNVNQVGPFGEVGALVTSVTKTFKMPYRPSENRFKCRNSHGEPTGAYWVKGVCYHGKYFKIMFATPKIVWPTKAIVSVSYNTSDYGTTPQRPQPCNGESGGCFYDSLNVGLTEHLVAPSVGTDPSPNDDYQNSQTAGNFCDGGAGGTGTFRLDAGCWEGYQPLLEVKAGL
jgi:hypothetical protein